jgi:hypothetical protein
VETSGRIIREGKRGYIAGLKVIGSPSALTHFIESTEQKFIKGIGLSRRLYV